MNHNSDHKIRILAESENGPGIIEINENIMALKFEFDKNYIPATCIVKNWILEKVNSIFNGKNLSN